MITLSGFHCISIFSFRLVTKQTKDKYYCNAGVVDKYLCNVLQTKWNKSLPYFWTYINYQWNVCCHDVVVAMILLLFLLLPSGCCHQVVAIRLMPSGCCCYHHVTDVIMMLSWCYHDVVVVLLPFCWCLYLVNKT